MPCLRLAIVCLLVAGLSAAGCTGRNEFKPPPPPKVTVDQPVEREVTDWVEFTGTTRATETVELRSRVKGYLQRLPEDQQFKDGSRVTQGDLLFVIEKAPFEAELEAAQANLAKAVAATQLAQANLSRTSELVDKNAISRQQFDVDTAELATAKATERAAQASVTQAELNLSYTEIRAPLSGRIGRHLVDPGNLVLPDQTLLAVVESIDPIHAYFYVSERELLRFMDMLRKGELPNPEQVPPKLFLALANEEDFPHEGTLDFREFGVDPATGTAERRGTFENDDLTLVPGMFVRIRASLGKARRVLVEERALGADQRGDFVLVVGKDNIVEYRPVKLGIQVEGLRVIEQGLAADETIVVVGLQRARPDAPVDPQQRPADEAQTAAITATKTASRPASE
jgi:RND family efflux transporter MFP subunit